MTKNVSRRKFVKTSAHLLGTLPAAMSAASYARVLGANDRIRLAFLGCGGRGGGHRKMVADLYKERNIEVVAVCDIWKNNREKAAADGIAMGERADTASGARHRPIGQIGTDHQNSSILE